MGRYLAAARSALSPSLEATQLVEEKPTETPEASQPSGADAAQSSTPSTRAAATAKGRWFEVLRAGCEAAQVQKVGVDYSERGTRAKELIRTCAEHSVGFRIDPDGITILSNGRAWKGLVDQLELCADEVVDLVRSGWTPYDA